MGGWDGQIGYKPNLSQLNAQSVFPHTWTESPQP